jgi:cell wall-associated NlpC family hydrolase
MSSTIQELPNATPGPPNVQNLPNATPAEYSTAQIQQLARQAAVSQGLNPSIFLALIQQESGFNPKAESAAGAMGLGQLMPATAAGLGVTNITDPIQNLRGAATYLKQQLNTFGGNYQQALAAYNAGPGAVKKYGGIPPYAETQNYVKTIMGNQSNFGGSASLVTPSPYAQPSDLPQTITKSINQTIPVTTVTPGKMQNISIPRSPLEAFGRTINKAMDLTKVYKDLTPATLAVLKATDQQISQKLQLPALPTTSTKMQHVTLPAGETYELQGKMSGKQLSSDVLGVDFTGGAKPSAEATNAVALAHEYLGTPYVYGGETPKGFDCSGLLQYIYAKQGVNIPRTTYAQYGSGQVVHPNDLQAGDAIFFRGSDPITQNGHVLPGHVGIYIGNGDIIQAPHTGANVEVTPLKSMTGYMGARRYS